ncbi:MAG: preprotein translocase subunit YajC [Paludibacteraceae bacterium]|nr:preprotein translocase subunit YajC [Paludibacteraceae bacterium]
MLLDFILLQDGAPAEVAEQASEEVAKSQGGSPWSMIIMMVLIFAVFYFFMIRPQRKQQKELQKKREAMKKGDKVVTAGGIFGEIKEVQENTFLITISKDVTIKVSKESVYADLTDASQAAATEKK